MLRFWRIRGWGGGQELGSVLCEKSYEIYSVVMGIGGEVGFFFKILLILVFDFFSLYIHGVN
jgi:hypothetical protein